MLGASNVFFETSGGIARGRGHAAQAEVPGVVPLPVFLNLPVGLSRFVKAVVGFRQPLIGLEIG